MKCEALRPSLELYAEGELRDPVLIGAVRSHLSVCASCREHLREYDDLTASILQLGASKFEGRAHASWRSERSLERTMARISLLEKHCPAPSRNGGGRRILWLLGAAAALLLACGSAFVLLWEEGSPTPVARDEALLRLQQAFDAAQEAPRDTDRRWVLDTSFAADLRRVRPSERLLRLYGLNLFEEADRSGFVVEAASAPGNPGTQKPRFYLVDEKAGVEGTAGAAGAIEIDPRAWFEARDLREVREQAREGRARLYRVILVPGRPALLDRYAIPQLDPEPTGSPWPGKRQLSDWIVPASW